MTGARRGRGRSRSGGRHDRIRARSDGKRAVRYLQDDRAPGAAGSGGCGFLRKHFTGWGGAGRFNPFDFELGQRAGSVREAAADHVRYQLVLLRGSRATGSAGLGLPRRSGSRCRYGIAASASVPYIFAHLGRNRGAWQGLRYGRGRAEQQRRAHKPWNPASLHGSPSVCRNALVTTALLDKWPRPSCRYGLSTYLSQWVPS